MRHIEEHGKASVTWLRVEGAREIEDKIEEKKGLMTGVNKGRGRRRSLGNLDFWVGSPMGSIYLFTTMGNTG